MHLSSLIVRRIRLRIGHVDEASFGITALASRDSREAAIIATRFLSNLLRLFLFLLSLGSLLLLLLLLLEKLLLFRCSYLYLLPLFFFLGKHRGLLFLLLLLYGCSFLLLLFLFLGNRWMG